MHKKVPHGLEFLAGVIIISTFATAKTLGRFDLLVGQAAHSFSLFLFGLLKVCAIAALIFGVCYGIYKLALWTRSFIALVRTLEMRISELENKSLPELTTWLARVSRVLRGVECDVEKLTTTVLVLEEGAKKTNESSDTAIGAVVSQIIKS